MKRLTLVFIGLSCWVLAAQRPSTLQPWDDYLPEEDVDPETTPYASSRVCKACHPSQYQSWYESYHRTMTQWASPESIVSDWDGVDFGYQGRSYRLFRRGDEFFVDMPRHGTAGVGSDERLELPVLMTTGSHQMQYYWLPVPWASPGERIEGEAAYEGSCAGCHHDDAEGGALEGSRLDPVDILALWDTPPPPYHRGFDDINEGKRRKIEAFLERIQFPGRLVQFPFVYFMRQDRWLHDSYTFLQPDEPYSSVEPYGKNWNGNCDGCHTTAPEYRWDRSEQLGQTRIAEPGIACEACHGPGRSHVERHKNPLRRYRAHFGDAPPDDIVNPASLDASASASVCAQCHAELVLKSDGDLARQHQVGEPIELSAHVLQLADPPYPEWLELALEDEPHLFRNTFWQDGTIRIAGRDYNGIVKSACFLEGELSCVTCHTMHGSEPNDQLRAEAKGDGACLSCHAELADDIEAHTHHPEASEGSRCYGCHMPYTTWGLLGSIRAHRIDSPSVGTSLATGRPNACNLCHLDRSLGDIADFLTRWYDQPRVDIPRPQRDVAASIQWLLSGDAVQRATIAWHMGYPPAKRASGDGWQAAYLAELLDDPYAAVRSSAFASLSEYAGFEDLRYDFRWPSFYRRKTVVEARGRVRLRGAPNRPALLIRGGELVYTEILALKALRDDTPVLVAE